MKRTLIKKIRLERRIKRVKYKTLPKDKERKRLIIHKTNRYLYAQIVDIETGKTLFSLGSWDKSLNLPENQSRKNKETAKIFGSHFAKLAIEKGIKKVYLDRRGRKYTGRIAAFADAAREAGLLF